MLKKITVVLLTISLLFTQTLANLTPLHAIKTPTNEKTQDIKNTTTQIKSLLQAKNITLHAKQIDQIASDIKAVGTEITTEVLNLCR